MVIRLIMNTINHMKGEHAMKKICIGTIVVCVLLFLSSCKKSQEEPKTTEKEQTELTVKKKPVRTRDVASSDATLTIVQGTGNTVGINLTNKIPVRGVQFTLPGVKITALRTTPRSDGFMANFNQESGVVIMLSLSGNKIAAGTGAIAEIICEEGGSPTISDIKIGK